MARITGLGGVLYLVKDLDATRNWYRNVLGLDGEFGPHIDWSSETGGRPFSVIFPFERDDYIRPGKGGFMINLRVDDLEEFVADLRKRGVEVNGPADEGYGKFAWLFDPDGIKIELWQQILHPDELDKLKA